MTFDCLVLKVVRTNVNLEINSPLLDHNVYPVRNANPHVQGPKDRVRCGWMEGSEKFHLIFSILCWSLDKLFIYEYTK